MIPDDQCNVVCFSSWLKSDYPDVYEGLTGILDRHHVAYGIIPGTNDVWCRDYMPLQLDKERFLCYTYRPDYLLKKPTDKQYITDSLKVCRDMRLKVRASSLVIDGGNVVKIGDKVIMTEKVFVENPALSKEELRKELERQMECEIIFIPWDRVEKYGHADGILKPISDTAILMTNYHDFDKSYADEVIKRLSSRFKIEMLSYKVPKMVPESWSYINFLTVDHLIVLPALGIEEDEQALEQVRMYYPDYAIEQLNISDLVKDGGGLNCVSWCWLDPENERRENVSGKR